VLVIVVAVLQQNKNEVDSIATVDTKM